MRCEGEATLARLPAPSVRKNLMAARSARKHRSRLTHEGYVQGTGGSASRFFSVWSGNRGHPTWSYTKTKTSPHRFNEYNSPPSPNRNLGNQKERSGQTSYVSSSAAAFFFLTFFSRKGFASSSLSSSSSSSFSVLTSSGLYHDGG